MRTLGASLGGAVTDRPLISSHDPRYPISPPSLEGPAFCIPEHGPQKVRVDRNHWQRRIGRLDPDVDFAEIYRILVAHEFPWDMRQSLSLALYRTYAVPSIARLLAATGELQTRTHKRYADTGLILDAVLERLAGRPYAA